MRLAFFKSVVDPTIVKAFEGSWEEALDAIEWHEHTIPAVVTAAVKRQVPCWAPVLLREGEVRSDNDAVAAVTALVLDFEKRKDGASPDADTILATWDDCKGWLHTTTGSTPEQPRYRLILEVDREMSVKEFKQVWAWAAAKCAAAAIPLDTSCKDPRRLWLLAYPQRAGYQSWDLTGGVLNVAMVLSQALDAQMGGAPVGAEKPEDGFLFFTEQGAVDPVTWMKTAKPGNALKGFCPKISDKDWNAPSAWLRRRKSGVFIGCTSDHHGHPVPLRMWLDDPNVTGTGKAGVQTSLVNMLDWKTDKQGNRTTIHESRHNLLTVLSEDIRIKRRLRFNEFVQRPELDDGPLSDSEVFILQGWVERTYSARFSSQDFNTALEAAARKHTVNPLAEELRSYGWDGKSRLDRWLTAALQVEDTELNRTFGRKWLVQAVARAMQPGCKADTVLVLVGGQGYHKSTALRLLAGDRWFSDTPIHMGVRQTYLQIAAKWIFELAELATVRKMDVETVKQFLSAVEDTFVPPYGRHAVTMQRHACFAATTNAPQFLVDDTGNRRFWPATVQDTADLDWLKDNRDQLLAEAVAAFDRGERWWFTAEEETKVAAARETFAEELPWEDEVYRFITQDTQAPAVTVGHVLEDGLRLETPRLEAWHRQRAAKLLLKFGWSLHILKLKGHTQRWYIRPNVDAVATHKWIRQQWGG